jgi:long-subunit fatty acid transport protein
MKNLLTVSAALLLTTTAVTAAGLDRSGQSVGIIFEEGNVVELTFGVVTPKISGTSSAALGSKNSGNMAASYTQIGVGVKYQLEDNLSVALIFDQPFGADVDYKNADPAYYTGAATASVSSTAMTAVARYSLNSNFSVHGGLRYQTVRAAVSKPTVRDYDIKSRASSAKGYLVGGAYERPDIALRVAVTYNSAVTHNITATETCSAPLPVCAGTTAVTSVDTPESINLEFQSGVAANTLVFGSVRYAKWTQFDYAPPVHASDVPNGLGRGSLQSYDNDTYAFALGVGRKFSDTWSGAVTVGYEKAEGGFSADLGPTDGNKSIGLGATYSIDNMEITGGGRYIMLGDATTENPTSPGDDGSKFANNSAIALGLKIAYKF